MTGNVVALDQAILLLDRAMSAVPGTDPDLPTIAGNLGIALLANPGNAVELIEQSRSVLWTQLPQAWGDLNHLRAAHPDIAAQLDSLRNELAAVGRDLA